MNNRAYLSFILSVGLTVAWGLIQLYAMLKASTGI